MRAAPSRADTTAAKAAEPAQAAAADDDDDDNYSDDQDLEYEEDAAADFEQKAPTSNMPLNIEDRNLVSGINSNVNEADRVKGKGFEAAELFMNDQRSQSSA